MNIRDKKLAIRKGRDNYIALYALHRKSFGFKVEGDYMKNVYLSTDSMHPSPLMFFNKLGATVTSDELDDYLNRNNQLSVKGFFNEHFKVVNEYLKPFLP